ncbi:unnamed protein product [Albugo candida]|uniref:SAM-dependent MTase RsmB/NOP-type domain-containing protein n=1 Tax=Albugo candida TaxID=65357 RepID=A0A024FW73_9STRA|nr:unnamed protein product [Albugo candida]|eukprot:CCI10904.1 unnamed protein product [Albugo candida]
MSDLYKEAASLLQKFENRRGGLKSLLYSPNIINTKSSFALVCETLRHKPLLEKLVAAVPLFQSRVRQLCKSKSKSKESQIISVTLATIYISIYDLLFGKKKSIAGGGFMKREIMKHANALREALVRMKIKEKVSDHENLLPIENRKCSTQVDIPRYIRVNTLKARKEEIAEFIETTKAQNDVHIPDLLVLPRNIELHDHELVREGKLVLQDKASCFPAFVLLSDPAWPGGDIIDACAAPGNKTTHLAMLLGKTLVGMSTNSKVFAFDRSTARLKILESRLELCGADGIVQASCQDFLDADIHDRRYENVKSIVLDPSCSGSGMNNRFDHLLDIASRPEMTDYDLEQEDGTTHKRIESLARFQLLMLRKAFSFDQVDRIVYSTCSVFKIENEEVVSAALATQKVKGSNRFRLKECLPFWPRRGIPVNGVSSSDAKLMVRANAIEDGTNGFFVAYFEREKDQVATTPRSLAITEQLTTENNTEKKSTIQRKRRNRKRKKVTT